MTPLPAFAPQRDARRQAVRAFKRDAILDAARAVFAERGFDGTTMRAVAARAGYAPGTLYLHYPGKEALYADMLGDSLARLGAAVKAAARAPGPPRARARRAFLAVFAYYRDHPRDLALGLSLFQGVGRRGVSPALERRLNGRLIAVLRSLADTLAAHGGGEEVAELETVSLVAHMVGCLFLDASGRLAILGPTAAALITHHLDITLDRLAGDGAARIDKGRGEHDG